MQEAALPASYSIKLLLPSFWNFFSSWMLPAADLRIQNIVCLEISEERTQEKLAAFFLF